MSNNEKTREQEQRRERVGNTKSNNFEVRQGNKKMNTNWL